MNNKLEWNSNEMAYFGECSDGAIVRVEGDDWSESIHEGAVSDAEHAGKSWADLSDDERSSFTANAEQELDDADWWATLAGDNPNVTMVAK